MQNQGQRQMAQQGPMQDDMMGSEYAEGAPEINGEELQMLMFNRIAELTPQEQQVFASIVTPQTAAVMLKMFPELGILFDQILSGQGGQAATQPPQATGQMMPGQPAPGAGEDHPFLRENVSRGLMG